MMDAEQTCVVVSVYNASPDIFGVLTEKATVVVLDPVLRVTTDGSDNSYQTIQVLLQINIYKWINVHSCSFKCYLVAQVRVRVSVRVSVGVRVRVSVANAHVHLNIVSYRLTIQTHFSSTDAAS